MTLPPFLDRPGEAGLYAGLMAILLALFILRVAGQFLVALRHHDWLPPRARRRTVRTVYRPLGRRVLGRGGDCLEGGPLHECGAA